MLRQRLIRTVCPFQLEAPSLIHEICRDMRCVWRRAFLLTFAMAVAAQLAGCTTSKVSVEQEVSAGSQPMVFSAIPGQAASAYDQSDRQLHDANWRELDKLGPHRSTLDKLVNSHDNKLQNNKPDNSTNARDVPFSELNATDKNQEEPTALPLTVAKLPDNRVQLIWHLRNIGGTAVTSRRDNGTSRETVTVKQPNLGDIIKVIESHLGDAGKVLPLPSQNALFINCKQDVQDSTVHLLDTLDVARAQVNIAAKIFETSHDFDYQQGARLLVERLASDSSQAVLSSFDTKNMLESLVSGAGPYQGSIIGMTQTLARAGVNVTASLQLLAQSGLISIVAAPHMTVEAGQSGYMLAGKELPIQSSQVSGTTVKYSTQYKPVGVQLYITPQAVGPDSVKLHLIVVVSSVEGFSPLATLNEGSTTTLLNPVIKSREAETVVTIRPGDTLVISGMKMNRNITREHKIPLLGDIPLLGTFFKSQRTQREMTDLYFFITPSLADAQFAGLNNGH